MSETLLRRLTTVASGFVLLATIGCGVAENDATDHVDQTQGAISGGWTTLPLINGWQAAGGSYHAPAVGKVNGVVVFRGAMKATNPTSTHAFNLPTAFQPSDMYGSVGGTSVKMKVVLSGGEGGTLWHDYLVGGPGTMKISQDGMQYEAVGQAAMTLTVLDGASFDATIGTPIATDWVGHYGFRIGMDPFDSRAWAKIVDGFVRFQGLIVPPDPGYANNYMFTLTDSAMIPGNMVLVYANIGLDINSWSWITIYPSGQVWVDGNNPDAWTKGVSLEGVSFSKTLTGNQLLPMSNGWTHYSARQARVGKYGDVVRFQGAVKNGTTTTIGTLPLSMRPTKTVKLPTIVYATTGTITITSTGVMTITNPGGLDNATLFTSLDGVSFGL